jgi:hypothetical protein
MERTITDRLTVLLVAIASLNVLWFGGGAVQALAVSQATGTIQVAGSLDSGDVSDYARIFNLTVAPLRAPAAALIQHVVYRNEDLRSRWSVE